MKYSDFVDICKIITDEIIYINMKIEFLFLIFLQLCIFCHDINSVIINFQMNYLKFFVNSEKVFFNIQVENFI